MDTIERLRDAAAEFLERHHQLRATKDVEAAFRKLAREFAAKVQVIIHGRSRAPTADATQSIDGFCVATGLKRSMVYEMLARGELETVYFGRRRLILMDGYRRLVAQRQAEQAAGAGRRIASPNPKARQHAAAAAEAGRN